MIRAVGVVVPAHDEERLLPSCLSALRRAARQVPGIPVHLLVVADACRDKTAVVAERGGAAVLMISARNVGKARAAGASEILRRARSLDPAEIWLATTDADTVVPSSWLRRQLRHAQQGWDAVVGTVEVADWSARPPALRSLFADQYGTGGGPHPHVHGANLGFRASAYLAAGGFPSIPTAEDHALVTAVAATGGKILRPRGMAVTTSSRRAARAPHGFAGYLTQLETNADLHG